MTQTASKNIPEGTRPLSAPGSIVFLPCTEIGRTVHFYRDVLGLPAAQQQGDSLWIFDTGYGYWGFCQYGDGRPLLSGPQGVCLSINLQETDDVLARYAALKDSVPVYRTPAWHPRFPVFSFFVLDPDGYLVEFQKINTPV